MTSSSSNNRRNNNTRKLKNNNLKRLFTKTILKKTRKNNHHNNKSNNLKNNLKNKLKNKYKNTTNFSDISKQYIYEYKQILSNFYVIGDQKTNIGQSIIQQITKHKIYGKMITDQLEKMFKADFLEAIKTQISELTTNNSNESDKYIKQGWKDCTSDNCFTKLRKQIVIETGSILYILKCFHKSIIPNPENNIKILISFLKDKNKFVVLKIGTNEDDLKNTNNSTKSEKGKLILGLGPSASGKTFWAEKIIEMTGDKKPYISIDGGIYREECCSYQFIVNTCIAHGFSGLNNLVETLAYKLRRIKKNFTSTIHGNFKEIMTHSSDTKKEILKLLNSSVQYSKDYSFMNIYLPETLGDCLLKQSLTKKSGCYSEKIEPYVKLTKDPNFTTLLIYQCKFGYDCIYVPTHKCKGCAPSGMARQDKEGKKYSSGAWLASMKYGLQLLRLQKGGDKFIIHNSGGEKYNGKMTKSTIIKVSNDDSNLYKELNQENKMKQYNYNLIDGRGKNIANFIPI